MTRRAVPERCRAIVVGLGVIGAAALDALAGSEPRGRWIGIDRHAPPHALGSSHGRTRVIRKAYFEDPAYVPLLHRAWSAWESLAREAGEALLLRTGALHLGHPDHPCVDGVRRAAREHALGTIELDAREVRARFPALAPHRDDVGILEEDGGILFAERCVAALLARARARGAEVRTAERASALEVGGSSVRVVTDRATYEADAVVLAQGAWSEGDASALAIPVPLRIERQVQLWWRATEPAIVRPDRMPVFVRFGAAGEGTFYGLPETEPGGGAKVCMHHGGETTRADALDRTIHAADEARVRAFVDAHLPSLAERIDARVCMYANTPDDHFVVGPHPAHGARVVLACGMSGHGFKLAPAIAELIADHVRTARPALPLFDPARFA